VLLDGVGDVRPDAVHNPLLQAKAERFAVVNEHGLRHGRLCLDNRDGTAAGVACTGYVQRDRALLLKDGTVTLLRTTPTAGASCFGNAAVDDDSYVFANATTATTAGFATNVKQLRAAQYGAFAVKADGPIERRSVLITNLALLLIMAAAAFHGSGHEAVADIKNISTFDDANRWTGGVTINYVPRSNFTHKLTVGLDAVNEEKSRLFPYFGDYGSAGVTNGQRNLGYRDYSTYTIDYLGTVNFKLPHNITSDFSFGGQGFLESQRLNIAVGNTFGSQYTAVAGTNNAWSCWVNRAQGAPCY
jgi:hypothetical protein